MPEAKIEIVRNEKQQPQQTPHAIASEKYYAYKIKYM